MCLSEERLKEVIFLCVSILPNIITILINGLLQLSVVYINVFLFLVSVPHVRPHAFSTFPYPHQPGHPPFPGYAVSMCFISYNSLIIILFL